MHASSVAQKLACLVALAAACDDGAEAIPVDPGDLDGDGVPNAADRCPLDVDPAQHDEDGDGIGDVCDVCPTVADPPQADRGEVDALAFEDGVGDACDPRPSRGGDKLVALHTFASASTSAWLGDGWTIEGDRVRAAGAARWQARRAQQGDTIGARLVVEELAWLGDAAALAVVVDGDGLGAGRSCAIVPDRDADGFDELETEELGGAIVVKGLPGPTAGPLTIIARRGIDRMGRGRFECRVELADQRAVSAAIDTIDATTTGQYTIATVSADATASSLVVYTSPVGCPTVALACDLPVN